MPGGIGIFGGTFDPVHLGHLRAAEDVREALALDEMRFVPAAVPPHKRRPLASGPERLRLLELAIAGTPGFRTWSVELERRGPSYSVDTLRTLRAEVGAGVRLVFVVGRDAFAELHTWRDYAAIFTLCDVAVMTRPPFAAALALDDFPVALRTTIGYDRRSGSYHHESGHRVIPVSVVSLDISATDIRSRLATGRSVRFLVPPAVQAHIESTGLYRSAGRT